MLDPRCTNQSIQIHTNTTKQEESTNYPQVVQSEQEQKSSTALEFPTMMPNATTMAAPCCHARRSLLLLPLIVRNPLVRSGYHSQVAVQTTTHRSLNEPNSLPVPLQCACAPPSAHPAAPCPPAVAKCCSRTNCAGNPRPSNICFWYLEFYHVRITTSWYCNW